MESYSGIPSPPSDDKRWKIVATTMRRHGYQRHALIETLHTVQQAFGFLDDPALRFVARSLRLPVSQAYGVATFYHFFSLRPPGEHSCAVCLGTACYIKGAPQLLEAVQSELDIAPGETTEDRKVSLLTARCLGSCGLAPAVVYDREVAGKVSPQLMRERLAQWRSHES